MAIKVGGTIVIDDSRNLANVANLKTVGGQSLLGSGDIVQRSGPLTANTALTSLKPVVLAPSGGLDAVSSTTTFSGFGEQGYISYTDAITAPVASPNKHCFVAKVFFSEQSARLWYVLMYRTTSTNLRVYYYQVDLVNAPNSVQSITSEDFTISSTGDFDVSFCKPGSGSGSTSSGFVPFANAIYDAMIYLTYRTSGSAQYYIRTVGTYYGLAYSDVLNSGSSAGSFYHTRTFYNRKNNRLFYFGSDGSSSSRLYTYTLTFSAGSPYYSRFLKGDGSVNSENISSQAGQPFYALSEFAGDPWGDYAALCMPASSTGSLCVVIAYDDGTNASTSYANYTQTFPTGGTMIPYECYAAVSNNSIVFGYLDDDTGTGSAKYTRLRSFTVSNVAQQFYTGNIVLTSVGTYANNTFRIRGMYHMDASTIVAFKVAQADATTTGNYVRLNPAFTSITDPISSGAVYSVFSRQIHMAKYSANNANIYSTPLTYATGSGEWSPRYLSLSYNTNSNLYANNLLGVADASYSAAASGFYYSKGQVANGFSSLTPRTAYYATTTGTVSSANTGNDRLLGYAISNTQMYITLDF